MDLLDDDTCMPIPENYVSLAQLKERWLKKQEETLRKKQQGAKIEGESESVRRRNGGLVIRAGEKSDKGKETVKSSSENGERSKTWKKIDKPKLEKGKQIVKNDSGNGKGKDHIMESDREVEKRNQIVKNGSERDEKKKEMKKNNRTRRVKKGKRYWDKKNNVEDGKMENEVDVVTNLEEANDDGGVIGAGVEINAGVSEDLDGKVTSELKGVEEDLSVSAMEILPELKTKSEISNYRRVRKVGSERKFNTRVSRGHCYVRKVKGENDNGNNTNMAAVYRMKENRANVVDLESRVEELKLNDGIREVDCKTDEPKGMNKDGSAEKFCVTVESRAEEELSDSNTNTIAKNEEKVSFRGLKSGERWGKINGSCRDGKFNEYIKKRSDGRSRSNRSDNGMVWVKKGEKFEANTVKAGSSGSKNDAGGSFELERYSH